jgi:exopolysaccharide biosynthesis polyprenyl glycosylphosphotransferase
MKTIKQRLIYILADYFSALFAWILFFIYRKQVIESKFFGYSISFDTDNAFFLGILIIPVFWIAVYFLSGYYTEVYRKSRLAEFSNTFISVLVGVLVIFFFLILDDVISSFRDYYSSLLFLFSIHFLITWTFRLLITSYTNLRIRKGELVFRALLIGSGSKAKKVYEQVNRYHKPSGTRIIGYLHVNGDKLALEEGLPGCLGTIEELEKILEQGQFSEVIIALERSEYEWVEILMQKLLMPGISVRTIPEIQDILTGRPKRSAIFDAPIVDISLRLMPAWQENFKHVFDLGVSFCVLVVFSPLMAAIALIIKSGSAGPVFFRHERIGRYGKPFTMYKFRTMWEDAERNGPRLSYKNDPRVTPFGRFLRRTKLDELPNFLNVLKGDMSIVGPRPERKFYIDQIMEKEPSFAYLLRVKPGITSWGQVRYGYAENLDEMIERLNYDLIYLDNMSLFVDFKILIYTFLILFRGRPH